MPTQGYSSTSTVGDYSVYVGELDPNVTDSILLGSFAPYKSVINAHVIVDPITKKSKKYGFVRFSNFEESQRAIYEMNGKYILSRPIKLNIGFKKSNPPAVTTAPSYVPSFPSYGSSATTGYSYPSTSYPSTPYASSSYPSSSYPSSSYPSSSYPAASYPPSSYPGYSAPPPAPVGPADPYKSSYPGYGYPSADPYGAHASSGYNYGQPSSAYSYPSTSQPASGYPPASHYPAPSAYSYPHSSYPSYEKPAEAAPAYGHAAYDTGAPDMNTIAQDLNTATQYQYGSNYYSQPGKTHAYF